MLRLAGLGATGESATGCHTPRRPVRRAARLIAAAAALLLHAAAAPGATAQAGATTGVIRGMVRDPTGQTVPGAVIVILHRETDLQTIVETTGSGAFVRTLLPPGTYDMTVTADGGYGVERLEGATLRVGETLDLAIDLRVVAAETVTVAADGARLVSTADVTSAQRVAEEVVDRLPSNGRNYLDLALLTPGASISQGPDGDVLNIAGQRGIFNNITVDGADFNNPFFGEQRGGQRPAFTFNQDAIEEIVVVNQGATAEFGRSAGGFVNVITKSGANDASGSAHYYGQWDEISAAYSPERGGGEPAFGRNQLGGTLGGPLVRDRAFYFLAYDQQAAAETRQTERHVLNPEALGTLETFLQSQWPGLFDDEFGPIRRTDDARSFLAKIDVTLDARHQLTGKYNHTWSEQVNGTFDVDAWGRSANGIERDRSHAFNTGLRSLLGNTLSNEFRLQWAREDRPRWYDGPLMPGAAAPGPPQFGRLGGRPFPDIGMDFADGFRIGLPFFLPIDPSYDTRLQVLDNASVLLGRHLVKAGVEYNRTRAAQQFMGFANSRYLFDSVDGFMSFATRGHRYVTCSDGSASDAGLCPAGAEITGPVLVYLQAATVPGVPPDQLGRQQLGTRELGLFVQDTWTPHDRLTLDLGLRWEGSWHPDVFVAPEDTFFAPYLDDPRFPSDGRIPHDLDNFQPRLGLAWDAGGDGRTVVRANAGSYVARIPMLVFAGHRTTNGAFQQLIFRSSAASPALGPVPPLDRQIDGTATQPFLPDVQVADRNLELPRTWSFSGAVDRDLGRGLAASVTVHPRPYRQPLPFRQPQRPRPRRAVRGRHAPHGRRPRLADRHREQRPLALSRRDARPAGTERARRPAHLRDELHARVRPFRRRQRTRPVPLPLRERGRPRTGVRLVGPRPPPRGERLRPAHPSRRRALRQRVPVPVGVTRLRPVRRAGRPRRAAVRPGLRRWIDSPTEHAAPGERVRHLGPPARPALRAGGGRHRRAGVRGVQRPECRQYPRHRPGIAALQLRRHDP